VAATVCELPKLRGHLRVKTYEGVPPPYDRTKRMVIPDALKVLRLQPGHKYCLLGELSKEVGWNYHDTIRVSIPLLYPCSYVTLFGHGDMACTLLV
jgi:hypothetical protein